MKASLRIGIFLILCFWICPDAVILGQSSRFYMESDRSKVQEGETIVITAVMENINSDAIEMPDFTPFQIVGGPSKASSISFVNGKKSSSVSYQYILLATQKGKFKLNPASAHIGSKKIYTNDLNIEVTQGSTPATFADDVSGDISLKIEISSKTGYTGQQILLDYVIYTRENIASYDFINQPNADGFFIQPVNNFQSPAQKKKINGKEYYTQIIARQILYPQKSGNYTIGPINMRADIPIENSRSSFFFRDTKPVTLSSNSIQLKVEDLPVPQPANFCGAVGEITLSATVNKATVSKGEAIVMHMQIEGSGDPKAVKAPKFSVPDGLEAYEPTLLKDESTLQNNGMSIIKLYEYIFIPKELKIYEIKPELSYLDPGSKTYKTATAGTLTINVVQGNVPLTDNEQLNNQNKYAVRENYTVFNPVNYQWNYYLYFSSISGIILLTWGGIMLKKRKTKAEETENISFNKAESVAQRHLAKAAAFIKDNQPKAFYEEIASATTGYVIKKFNIPHSEVSVSNIVRLLQDKNTPSNIIRDYEWIHKQAELARFAGTYGDIREVYDVAVRFISEMTS